MPPGCAEPLPPPSVLRGAPCTCSLGRIEQWVGREKRVLGPGDVAHVPRDEVHGSYNDFSEPCVFLAVLSENRFDGPAVIDMSTEEPWSKLRAR